MAEVKCKSKWIDETGKVNPHCGDIVAPSAAPAPEVRCRSKWIDASGKVNPNCADAGADLPKQESVNSNPILPPDEGQGCSPTERSLAARLPGLTPKQKLHALWIDRDFSDHCSAELAGEILKQSYSNLHGATDVQQTIQDGINSNAVRLGTFKGEAGDTAPMVAILGNENHPQLLFSSNALGELEGALYDSDNNQIHLPLEPRRHATAVSSDCALKHELGHWGGDSELTMSRQSAACDPQYNRRLLELGEGNLNRGILRAQINGGSVVNYVSAAMGLASSQTSELVASMLPGGRRYNALINDMYSSGRFANVHNPKAMWEGLTLDSHDVLIGIHTALTLRLAPGTSRSDRDASGMSKTIEAATYRYIEEARALQSTTLR